MLSWLYSEKPPYFHETHEKAKRIEAPSVGEFLPQQNQGEINIPSINRARRHGKRTCHVIAYTTWSRGGGGKKQKARQHMVEGNRVEFKGCAEGAWPIAIEEI